MKTFPVFFLFVSLSLSLVAQKTLEEEISLVLDRWHQAAADNDQAAYFELIDSQGIYIGTDSSEHWTRQEFYEWSTPYFAQMKGWAFEKINRHVYLSENGNIAWFDELLSYGKGCLRGSGVLIKRGTEWHIVHYVLSVPVPNDKYKDVMKLIDEKPFMTEDREE